MSPAAPHVFNELMDMKKRMDFLYRSSVVPLKTEKSEAAPPGKQWEPATDVFEDDRMWVAMVDLPGVDDDHLSVEVEQGRLVIRAERKVPRPEGMREVLRQRTEGAYVKELLLPPKIDRENISAEFRKGVLTIRVPKLEPEVRKVAVKPSG